MVLLLAYSALLVGLGLWIGRRVKGANDFFVAGRGLAAVFSAELSSADAVLFMLTTSLSQDLYKRFVAPASSDTHILAVARVTTIVAGAIGTALAIVSPTVIGLLSIFYTLLGVSLFVPILGGLYVARATTAEALASIASGVGAMLYVHVTTSGTGYGSLTPALVGFLAASAAFVIVLTGRGFAPRSAFS